MSSKVAFYILADSSLKNRDLYACRIIEKAYLGGNTVYVYVANLKDAENFDIQLWTFRDISFVPHEIYNQNQITKAPVLIGIDAPAIKQDILINLTSEIPLFYQQFNHIIEIIPNDDNLKTLGRKRYQTYQKAGLQMETFNIDVTS